MQIYLIIITVSESTPQQEFQKSSEKSSSLTKGALLVFTMWLAADHDNWHFTLNWMSDWLTITEKSKKFDQTKPMTIEIDDGNDRKTHRRWGYTLYRAYIVMIVVYTIMEKEKAINKNIE